MAFKLDLGDGYVPITVEADEMLRALGHIAEEDHAKPKPVPEVSDDEWNLTVDDMMRMLSKPRRWLFENKRLPFIRQVSRKTIIGDKGLLKKWIVSRRAK